MHQPLRTKHCRDCGRCVRTHDHHCPWVGTCVGEGNRLYFYWFLGAQSLELLTFFLEALTYVRRRGFILSLFRAPLLILGMTVMIFLLIMVICLFIFHSYLAMVNVTTWESMSWHHITYLRSIPPEDGSPFGASLRTNLVAYCCAPWFPAERAAVRCTESEDSRSSLKRTEDGWMVWELGEPTQPLEVQCGGHTCNLCPCMEDM